jgi:hypothetical protein
VKSVLAFILQLFANTIETLCNRSRNAGQGVTVSTKGHSSANDILERFSFQKGCDGLRNGFLAGFDMVVARADRSDKKWLNLLCRKK